MAGGSLTTSFSRKIDRSIKRRTVALLDELLIR
jgi:hypothetical protein